MRRTQRKQTNQVQVEGDGVTIPARGMLGCASPDAIQRLSLACRLRTFPAQTAILSAEEQSRFVSFMIAGLARVVLHTPDGRTIRFRDLRPGDVFGELAAIDGQVRSANVEAVTTCTLAVIAADEFIRIVDSEPSLSMALRCHLTMQIRTLTSRVYEFNALPVPGRIRAELLRLAQQAHERSGEYVIDPRPRHEEIASRLATNREAVSREIRFLSSEGIVAKVKGALIVNDINALASLVAHAEGRRQ